MPYGGRRNDKFVREVENDDEKLAVGPTVCTLPLTFSLSLSPSLLR